eukprot:1202181-Rhodomonas_salina.1
MVLRRTESVTVSAEPAPWSMTEPSIAQHRARSRSTAHLIVPHAIAVLHTSTRCLMVCRTWYASWGNREGEGEGERKREAEGGRTGRGVEDRMGKGESRKEREGG